MGQNIPYLEPVACVLIRPKVGSAVQSAGRPVAGFFLAPVAIWESDYHYFRGEILVTYASRMSRDVISYEIAHGGSVRSEFDSSFGRDEQAVAVAETFDICAVGPGPVNEQQCIAQVIRSVPGMYSAMYSVSRSGSLENLSYRLSCMIVTPMTMY